MKRRQEVRSFGTFARDLDELADWLESERVTQVAMEATGVYWKPIWQVLEDRDFELLLVNPTHVKKVPGRKTDVKDAEWIAQLLECGLLRGSLRSARSDSGSAGPDPLSAAADPGPGKGVFAVQKVLEDAGVKLASVASDGLGVSGRSMLEALIAGERDPEVLAEMALRRMRSKIPELREALAGSRFREHHGVMLRAHLDRVDHLDESIAALEDRVDALMAPFSEARDHLMTIPGVSKRAAEVIIAEVGVE